MQDNFDLMVRSPAFNQETVPIGRCESHRSDEQTIPGLEAKLSRAVSLAIARRRNSRRVEGSVLGCTRDVSHTHALVDDTNEAAIYLGGVRLVDLSCEPRIVFCGHLRE